MAELTPSTGAFSAVHFIGHVVAVVIFAIADIGFIDALNAVTAVDFPFLTRTVFFILTSVAIVPAIASPILRNALSVDTLELAGTVNLVVSIRTVGIIVADPMFWDALLSVLAKVGTAAVGYWPFVGVVATVVIEVALPVVRDADSVFTLPVARLTSWGCGRRLFGLGTDKGDKGEGQDGKGDEDLHCEIFAVCATNGDEDNCSCILL
jgi:hypothetical protein